MHEHALFQQSTNVGLNLLEVVRVDVGATVGVDRPGGAHRVKAAAAALPHENVNTCET